MLSNIAPSSRSTARRRPLPKRGSLAAEVLEQRVLLTYASDFGDIYEADPEYGSQVIGRASDGVWWTSEIDFALDHGPDVTTTFAAWSTVVDWRFVGRGDFDGDGLDDIAGWDPAGGGWWVSLSDGIGSTTRLGTVWSTSTTWSDVTIADANADGLDDIIGRASNGNWYTALSNSEGQFHNIASVTWDANGGWRDVFVADVDQNGLNDLVGRSAAGVWQVSYAFAFTNHTVTVGQWDESQGWQDAMIVVWPFADQGTQITKIAIVARSNTGTWQALAFHPNRTAETVLIGTWNEAANWRDVMIAKFNDQQIILGRTDYGEWWSGQWVGGEFHSIARSTWNEAAGWSDVYWDTANATSADYIIGRTDDGQWWASQLWFHDLGAKLVGHWNPGAGWQDVTHGTFTRSPINTHAEIRYEFVGPRSLWNRHPVPVAYTSFVIYAHRNGTEARITRSTNDAPVAGYLITYRVPSTGYETSRFWTPPERQLPTRFFGRNGNDTFINSTTVSSQGWGLGGADIFDGRNGVYDEFFGGTGVDVLLGDAGDKLVQD